MEPATGGQSRKTSDVFLAGLEAGMVAALWLLAWMGATAILGHRGFWTFENLLASAFFGGEAIRPGIGWTTISGLALCLLLYSLLGALFALALRDRLSRFRLTLAGMLFAICWYYFSFRLLWRAVAPLAALLYIEGPTRWGHLIYGAVLGRYLTYLARWEKSGVKTPSGPPDGPAEPTGEAVAPLGESRPDTIA